MTDAETDPHPAATATPTTSAVVAVVVGHHGARWLSGLQVALMAQTRRPEVIVAADTSGPEAPSTGQLLTAWLGAGHVVALDERTGFGSAVAAALELPGASRPDGWIWLLHDDCAPDPGALAALLAAAVADPEIGIAGPKVLGLVDRRLLLEVGVSMSRSGRRHTGLERRERDQGQHDGVRRVLAVGTAGLLVRRAVWDELGGLDPRLPLLRDDVDLGWRATLAGYRVVVVTSAVLHHAEAGSHRRRPIHAGGASAHLLDRRHALWVLLTNLPGLSALAALPWMVVAGLVRSLGLLLGKRPRDAADEAWALVSVVGRPDRVLRARLARRATRRLSPRAAQPLLAPRGAAVRHGLETASLYFGTAAGQALGGRHRAAPRAIETGPGSADADELPSARSRLLQRLLLRPPVLLLLGLLALALLADRHLFGAGRLTGGALLPAPGSVASLWQSYLSAWHPVGVGTHTGASPYLAVLALLGFVTGDAGRGVHLLLLGAVPLAGLSAYIGLRPLVRPRLVRVLAAATYALLPPLLGAVAAGRVGTVVVAILLPLVALSLARAFGLRVPRRPLLRLAEVFADRPPGAEPEQEPAEVDSEDRQWRSAWWAGLLVAVAAAFVPLAWAVAAGVTVGLAVLAGRRTSDRVRGLRVLRRHWGRAGAVLVTPLVLLLPWLPDLVADPRRLLLEAGAPGPGLATRRLDGLDLLMLHPGGPGLPPLVLGIGLLAAALAALLRRDKRRAVLAGWVLALVALAGVVVLSRLSVRTPTLAASVPVWPGMLSLVAGAGLLIAAATGAAGARGRVVRSSFGWRQPAAIAVLALAVICPAVSAVWWVAGTAGGPLARRSPTLLPAFLAAAADHPARPRTLVLRPRADGTMGYALLRATGPRTGDAEVSRPVSSLPGLDAAVADLTSGRGGDAAARLVPYGVRFVLLSPRRPAGHLSVSLPTALVRTLDGVPGVERVSSQGGSVLWQIAHPVARLRVLPPGAPVVGADGGPPPALDLPAGPVSATARVPSGPSGRVLVLADARDSGWRATLDGHQLEPRRYAGWAQAFVLPPGAGTVHVRYDAGLRPLLLWAQLGAVLLVLLLALPPLRGSIDAEGDADPGAGEAT